MSNWDIFEAAVKSFYDLIFSLRIDLPKEEVRSIDPPTSIKEMNPFTVELPSKKLSFALPLKIFCDDHSNLY